MKIEPDTVSEKSINYWIIENHTNTDINVGFPFSLEYFDENSWKPLRLTFIEVDDTQIVGNSFIRQINLFFFIQKYNNGKKGKYRISKYYLLPGIGEFNLCAEFEAI